jgi:hypothetical protein
MTDLDTSLATAGILIGALSIVILLAFEVMRRPRLEFVPHDDNVTDGDRAVGHMWYHVKVRNKEPHWPFNRDAALRCWARVEYLDAATRSSLPGPNQISSHWAGMGEPKSGGKFEPSFVPTCQRTDVGFREEMFDVAIKRDGELCFYRPDPWEVYRDAVDLSKLKVAARKTILRVEVEAINSGRTLEGLFRLEIVGPGIEGLKLFPLCD